MRFVGWIAGVIQVISVRNPSFIGAFTEQLNVRRNRLPRGGFVLENQFSLDEIRWQHGHVCPTLAVALRHGAGIS